MEAYATGLPRLLFGHASIPFLAFRDAWRVGDKIVSLDTNHTNPSLGYEWQIGRQRVSTMARDAGVVRRLHVGREDRSLCARAIFVKQRARPVHKPLTTGVTAPASKGPMIARVIDVKGAQRCRIGIKDFSLRTRVIFEQAL